MLESQPTESARQAQPKAQPKVGESTSLTDGEPVNRSCGAPPFVLYGIFIALVLFILGAVFIMLNVKPCQQPAAGMQLNVTDWSPRLVNQIMQAEAALHHAIVLGAATVCLNHSASRPLSQLQSVFDLPEDGCLRSLNRSMGHNVTSRCCYAGGDYGSSYGACGTTLTERISVGVRNLPRRSCGVSPDLGDSLVIQLRASDEQEGEAKPTLQSQELPCSYYRRVANYGLSGEPFARVIVLVEPQLTHPCLSPLQSALGAAPPEAWPYCTAPPRGHPRLTEPSKPPHAPTLAPGHMHIRIFTPCPPIFTPCPYSPHARPYSPHAHIHPMPQVIGSL